jgi:tRNA A-37 threonylcarbamoyl transferase component Bud32
MIDVGQTIGNYRITAKLGEGGMGVVYLAEHPVIGRKVALKAIHPELSRNPDVVSRFMTEAKSVNQIGNEHIVDVSDFGTTSDGEFYFIMEYLNGESVADRLRRERLFDPHRALQIAAQVADALAASHSHGIIHRDLKPENIFLINRGQNRDFVKVLDFGLAKLTQGEEKVTHKTRTGSVMGTPYYMAPEQCEGKTALDFRADIYSLGIIVFEMMTGKVPFGGEGYGEIIVKHLTQPPPEPRDFNPIVTPAQQAVVMRSLAKSRDDRFSSMEEFRAAMLDPDRFVLESQPAISVPTMVGAPGSGGASGSVSRPVGDPGSGGRASMPSTFGHGAGEMVDEDFAPPRSRKGLVVGALLAAAVAGAGAVFYVRQQSPSQAAPTASATSEPGSPAAPPAPTGELPPVAPAAPEKVTISFSSLPSGAVVTMKDTGEVLGTTPFDREMPPSETPLSVVFKKPGYEETEQPLVPKSSGPLNASLRPTPPPTAVAEEPAARSKPAGRSSSRRAGSGSSGSKDRKPGGRRGDQPGTGDDVLMPDFLKSK